MHRLWKFSSAILLDKEPLCSHQLPCPSPPVSDPDLLTCISERFLKFSWGIWPLPSPLSNWGSETGGHCTARLNSVSISWLSSYNSPIMETLGQTLTGSTTLPKPLFLVFNPFSKITCTYPKDYSAVQHSGSSIDIYPKWSTWAEFNLICSHVVGTICIINDVAADFLCGRGVGLRPL